MKRTVLLILWLVFFNLVYAGMVVAALIPTNAVIASLDSNRGDGLNGLFFDTGSSMTNLENADDFVASNAPTRTFRSSLVDYPNGSTDTTGDSTRIDSYLGVDANALSGSGDIALNGSIFVFSGFIAIYSDFDIDTSDADIDISFAVGSDDGFRLNIGGITVTSHAGSRNYDYSAGIASFESEGLYAVELVYYEGQDNTGIEWYSTIPGGPDSGVPSIDITGFADIRLAGIVPTSVLSTSPVPIAGAVWLLGSGLAGLVVARRKKMNR